MKAFILKHLVEFILGAAVGCLSLCYKKLTFMFKKRTKEQDAIKSGMIAILHDRLFQSCNYYLELGYIPLDKAEEILDNLKILYDAYHDLGGNGTGTDIYNRTKELPLKKAELKEILSDIKGGL